jgi:hypothetical protein
VDLDADRQLALLDDRRGLLQQLTRLRRQLAGLVEHDRLALEIDAIGALFRPVRRAHVGAAVFILEAVDGLRIVRALVLVVGDAVAVVVHVGTAVVVLEAVFVFRIVRALVDRIGDAVVVVVAIRAAVGVLEAVFVLRLVGTLVLRVGDAVAVVVGIRATVFVLEAVFVFRLVGARVARIGNAVAVAVAQIAGACAERLRRPRQPALHHERRAAIAALLGADQHVRGDVRREPDHHARRDERREIAALRAGPVIARRDRRARLAVVAITRPVAHVGRQRQIALRFGGEHEPRRDLPDRAEPDDGFRADVHEDLRIGRRRHRIDDVVGLEHGALADSRRGVRDDARLLVRIGPILERELRLVDQVLVAEQHVLVAERQEHAADRRERDARRLDDRDLEADVDVERTGDAVAEIRRRIVRARRRIDVRQRAQRDQAARRLLDDAAGAVQAALAVARTDLGAVTRGLEPDRDAVGDRHAEREVELRDVVEDVIARRVAGHRSDARDRGVDRIRRVAAEQLERDVVDGQEPRALDRKHAVAVVRRPKQHRVDASRRIGERGRRGNRARDEADERAARYWVHVVLNEELIGR